MSDDPKTRSHETIIEIAAPPETVWRGITEAEEIVRWFAPEARVEPGQGGSIFVSWGGPAQGTSRIAVWEPGRHLKLIEERPHGPRHSRGDPTAQAAESQKPVEVAVDYYLESSGGSTVLRLVHSGFGTAADWDNEFESTRYGWMMFVRNLRHALTRHLGVACRQATLFVPSSFTPPESWSRVMAAFGPVEGLGEGDRFSWRASNGDEISGVVQMAFPPIYFGGSLEQAGSLKSNDALFGITAMPSSVMLNFMFYGLSENEAEAIQSRWTELVRSAVAANTSAACSEAAT